MSSMSIVLLHPEEGRDGETLMLIHDKDYFVLVLIYYTKLLKMTQKLMRPIDYQGFPLHNS